MTTNEEIRRRIELKRQLIELTEKEITELQLSLVTLVTPVTTVT
jgi:hypothetical protein